MMLDNDVVFFSVTFLLALVVWKVLGPLRMLLFYAVVVGFLYIILKEYNFM